MPLFADDRDANEFVIRLIVSEAEREGIAPSELERNMLYFSESGWTPPDMAETVCRFARECDSGQYETKIAAITKKVGKRLKADDRPGCKPVIRRGFELSKQVFNDQRCFIGVTGTILRVLAAAIPIIRTRREL